MKETPSPMSGVWAFKHGVRVDGIGLKLSEGGLRGRWDDSVFLIRQQALLPVTLPPREYPI